MVRRLSNEQMGRVIAGLSVGLVVALGTFHHTWWYVALVGIGANLVVSGVTNRCPFRTLLLHLGFPLERDLGRQDARGQGEASGPMQPGTAGGRRPWECNPCRGGVAGGIPVDDVCGRPAALVRPLHGGRPGARWSGAEVVSEGSGPLCCAVARAERGTQL
jgi:hypothetical protein